MSASAKVSIVVLTYNRKPELLRTLERLARLPGEYPAIVVDNGSTDGTFAAVCEQFPGVGLLRAPRNLGAAGRNLGVEVVQTPYVAFCDDDTCWEAGALDEAARILDVAASVGIVSARILVGPEGRPDPACVAMSHSALGAGGLPGVRLLGFMAGACVMRTQVFRELGGYLPALFIGGEEMLLALDAAQRGWDILYAPTVVTRHFPSQVRDLSLRRKLLARNAMWTAWMRLPAGWALAESGRQLVALGWADALDVAWLALRGMPAALARRSVVSERVLRMLACVRAGERGFCPAQADAPATQAQTPASEQGVRSLGMPDAPP